MKCALPRTQVGKELFLGGVKLPLCLGQAHETSEEVLCRSLCTSRTPFALLKAASPGPLCSSRAGGVSLQTFPLLLRDVGVPYFWRDLVSQSFIFIANSHAATFFLNKSRSSL